MERAPTCGIGDFERIWPFLKSGFEQTDTEFTLSRYLKDRAFFATALAEQPHMVSEPGMGPLCYLVLEDTLNTWQLGRLVYRMHRAGTARVAAAMHFDKIKTADGILADVEHRLRKGLRDATPLREQDEDMEREAHEQLRKQNDEIEQSLAKIWKDDFDGTLDYRIERSHYYASQFERITKTFRIERVQGFQTYTEFVEQRLGPIFEYIGRIGKRHARVESDRGLLLRRLMALEALYEERFISRAQRYADAALFGVLGPYYLMSLVDRSALPYKTFCWGLSLAYALCYSAIVGWSAFEPKGSKGKAEAEPRRTFKKWVVKWRFLLSILFALLVTGFTYWVFGLRIDAVAAAGGH